MATRRKAVKRYLEYFDKKNDKWVRVSEKEFSEEAIKIYDYITAEMEIRCLIEDMENTKLENDKTEKD
tara:strand:+ start:300 stop:503 length:204 start_codon:yes stop_codon:yes gene_type:complete